MAKVVVMVGRAGAVPVPMLSRPVVAVVLQHVYPTHLGGRLMVKLAFPYSFFCVSFVQTKLWVICPPGGTIDREQSCGLCSMVRFLGAQTTHLKPAAVLLCEGSGKVGISTHNSCLPNTQRQSGTKLKGASLLGQTST